MVQGGDDAPRAQEQQRLEEGVGQQVKGGGGQRPGPDPQHHVADLADGGIGQDPLQVTLGTGAGGGVEGREPSGNGNGGQGNGRRAYQREHAGQQVDPGRDHGGGVDLGRDRRGTGHGVRQPDRQRQLGRFAGRADQQQDPQGGDDPGRQQKAHTVQLGNGDSAQELVHPDHGNAEGGVSDAGDDKGLAPGSGVLLLRVPEADQGVGAEADPFPPQVKERQVFGQDQGQHGKDKDVQQGKVTGKVRIVLHVADGVQVNQAADKGDHQGHGKGKLVQVERYRGLEVEVRQPGCVLDPCRSVELECGQHGADECPPDGGTGDDLNHASRKLAPGQGVDQAAAERKQEYEGEVMYHWFFRLKPFIMQERPGKPRWRDSIMIKCVAGFAAAAGCCTSYSLPALSILSRTASMTFSVDIRKKISWLLSGVP